MFLFCSSLKTDFLLTYSYILVSSDTFVFVKIRFKGIYLPSEASALLF